MLTMLHYPRLEAFSESGIILKPDGLNYLSTDVGDVTLTDLRI